MSGKPVDDDWIDVNYIVFQAEGGLQDTQKYIRKKRKKTKRERKGKNNHVAPGLTFTD